jgi:hypothetical protein
MVMVVMPMMVQRSHYRAILGQQRLFVNCFSRGKKDESQKRFRQGSLTP